MHFITYTVHKKYRRLLLLSLLLFVLSACGSAGTGTALQQASPTSTQQTHPIVSQTPTTIVHVSIILKDTMYAFVPATVKVKVGTQVVWKNTSNAPHTVSSDDGVFNTPNNLEQNQSYAFLFTKAGTYPYYCNFHLYMKGTIIVTS